jgi:hypothetical protein
MQFLTEQMDVATFAAQSSASAITADSDKEALERWSTPSHAAKAAAIGCPIFMQLTSLAIAKRVRARHGPLAIGTG